MPFCTHCGNEVSPADTYCGRCGTRQRAEGTAASTDFLAGVSRRTMSILCYVPLLGWIACIFVLASQRFQDDRNLRFHAFQGLYIFVAWLLVDWALTPFFGFFPGPGRRLENLMEALLTVAIYAAWIVMLIKTSQEQHYSLPILGELAERSVSEQR